MITRELLDKFKDKIRPPRKERMIALTKAEFTMTKAEFDRYFTEHRDETEAERLDFLPLGE